MQEYEDIEDDHHYRVSSKGDNHIVRRSINKVAKKEAHMNRHKNGQVSINYEEFKHARNGRLLLPAKKETPSQSESGYSDSPGRRGTSSQN